MGLFSKSTVNKILSDDKERRGDFGKPPLPIGEHLFTLSNIELGNTKQTNDEKITLTYSADDNHAPIQQIFMLTGNQQAVEIAERNITTFMADAFKHEMQECADAKALLTQLLKFKGKRFKGAVRIKERLYKFTDAAGKDGITIMKEPSMWYAGTADDTNFKVNVAKAFLPLSSDDKAAYMAFKAEHPDSGNASAPTQQAAELDDQNKEEAPF